MKPKISIIIPCYNTEDTLDETLNSVLEQDFKSWEAIIINDGSPDDVEKVALKWEKKDSRFKYFKKSNGGLGTARNFGIQKSQGEFILPLDSDNKIKSNFASKAISIFNAKADIGVIYGDALYFGDKDGRWSVGNFNPIALLEANYIDACALYRKTLYDETKGYDSNLPYQGHEDWDFWLQVIHTNYKFYYMKAITFDYRVKQDSMIRSFTVDMERENIAYIMNKHYKLYLEYYPKLYAMYKSIQIESNKSIKERLIRKLKRLY
ncbi:glycosyltransferase family A protein [uncultured Lacinutrix sp.]|uniref:glycosyltransferase family 2 protein n=1 Tax=uncultured Lacinutrix sp. TaxID=574032 RepID=UPI0026166D54|nr:glycosyltransferase family A protein [uncultured Lacinutrix sp.]